MKDRVDPVFWDFAYVIVRSENVHVLIGSSSDLQLALQAPTEADLHESTKARQTEWGYRAIVRDPDGRAVELCEI